MTEHVLFAPTFGVRSWLQTDMLRPEIDFCFALVLSTDRRNTLSYTARWSVLLCVQDNVWMLRVGQRLPASATAITRPSRSPAPPCRTAKSTKTVYASVGISEQMASFCRFWTPSAQWIAFRVAFAPSTPHNALRATLGMLRRNVLISSAFAPATSAFGGKAEVDFGPLHVCL